jgi:nitroreductase
MGAVGGALGLAPEAVEAVLRSAVAAPSLHNGQPWRFRVMDKLIELHADPRRGCPVVDPEGRELRLGCGAALFNLRLALEHAGVRPLVTLLPDGTKSTLLAAVRGGGSVTLAADRSALFRAIASRRTNRRPFLDDPVPKAHRQALVRSTRAERSWLYVVEDRAQRAALRELLVRAHSLQTADPAFRAELAEWTGRRVESTDGVPVTSAGPSPEPQDEWVLRDFGRGQGQSRLEGKDFEDEPLLVVLCSFHSGPLAELQAGQALQRTLLTATSLGLAASFLAQVVEVPRTREELRQLLGGSIFPQTVLRLGYGSFVPATPRRPLAESLLDVPVGP